MYHFRTGIVIMPYCDNLGLSGARDLRHLPESITAKRPP
jgi:hypothetical protein